MSISKPNYLNIIKTYWPYPILFGVWCAIVFANYQPGTLLSGWDNLHPEFDFWLNVRRSLSATWQEYQGLGLLTGMAHSADLSRQLILWSWSIILPESMLRYAWTFLMLLIGVVGAYRLLIELFQTNTHTKPSKHLASFSLQIANFCGALFYLLNLSTVQNFFVPYESFSSFYGFLPWLLLVGIQYLKSGKRKDLLLLLIVHLLSASAFYVQTLFVVFVTLFGLFAVEYILKTGKTGFKRSFIAFLTIIIVHSFWLLPALYFTATNAQVTVDAHQNKIATTEVQLMNQGYGTLDNIAKLKGFWFDYTDISNEKRYVYLLEPWREFTSSPLIQIIEYLLFVIAFAGVVSLCFTKKTPFRYSVVISFFICIFLLSSGNGLLGSIYNFLGEHLPLFGQMFRSAFTKWSSATSLFYAIGIAATVSNLDLLSKKIRLSAGVTTLFVLAGMILISVAPIFSGKLFYQEMRVQFPNEYMEVMKFFRTQPKQTRIAFLPAHQQWGWNFYSWGYRGSGFLWYGIEQPILDRAFDVWSKQNEDFYFQFSAALDDDNPSSVANLLKLYQVDYLLIDKSVISPDKKNDVTQIGQLTRMMNTIGARVVFSQGDIVVYRFLLNDSFVQSPLSYRIPDASIDSLRRIPGLLSQGNFVKKEDTHSTDLPLAGLDKISPDSAIAQNGNVVMKVPLLGAQGQALVVPNYFSGETYVTQMHISLEGETVSVNFPEKTLLILNDKEIELPQLEDFTINLGNTYESVFIQINAKEEYFISQTSPLIKEVGFRVGEPIELTVFNSEAGRIVNNQPVINKEDTVEHVLNAEVWAPFTQEIVVPLSADQSEMMIESSMIPYQFPAEKGKYVSECDTLQRGEQTSQFTEQSQYTTSNFGAICDTIPMFYLRNDKRYLMRLNGENVQGRSLKFYLQNLSSNQADLEELLPAGKFDLMYNLLPWPSLTADLGYYLNIETRSLGGELAENEITQITVYTIASKLNEIRIDNENTVVSSSLAVKKQSKIGTTFYDTLLFNNDPDSLLTLSQAYDNGWIAFSTDKPFKLLEHVQYNGWANGWIVNEVGEQEIVMIYWPQMLEFAGFGMLSGFGLIMMLKVIKR